MALTEAYSVTQTVGTTEFSFPNNSTTLTPIVDTGVFDVVFDTAAITLGDQFQFRLYEKVTSGGTQRIIYESIITGPMADTIVFPSLHLRHGWDVTAKKLAGTDRSILCSIRKAA